MLCFALLVDFVTCWRWLTLPFSLFCQTNTCNMNNEDHAAQFSINSSWRLQSISTPCGTVVSVELWIADAVSLCATLKTQKCLQKGLGWSSLGVPSQARVPCRPFWVPAQTPACPWGGRISLPLGCNSQSIGTGPAPTVCEFVSGRDSRGWGQTPNGSNAGNVSRPLLSHASVRNRVEFLGEANELNCH